MFSMAPEDQIKTLAGKASENLLRLSPLWNILNIGDVDVRNIFLNVEKTFIMSLGPTTILMGSDQNGRDVKHPFLDSRDFKATGLFSNWFLRSGFLRSRFLCCWFFCGRFFRCGWFRCRCRAATGRQDHGKDD
jgi:hypothetical protein